MVSIDEKKSQFEVIVECFYFWKDPAILRNPSIMDDTVLSAVVWCLNPHHPLHPHPHIRRYPQLEPREMVQGTVLREGAVKFLMANEKVIAQQYGHACTKLTYLCDINPCALRP